MKTKIILLLDYQGRFSSKWSAKPYRSGMNLDLLKKEFQLNGYEVEYLHYSDINFRERNFNGEIILYTSSEDSDLFYKSYIEDIIYALEMQGANLIPSFKFIKAHHNKVFMEIMRDLSSFKGVKNIQSDHFGTLEDFEYKSETITYPKVFKGASGAVSSSVRMVKSKNEVTRTIKKLCRSKAFSNELWDLGRSFKYKGYKKESKYRKKFILQNFRANMNKDWKIIVFGEKYFVLERKVRKNDFRASGSGLLSYNKDIPKGLLDYAHAVFKSFNIAFFAMDIGYDGENFCLLEFQAINFGTHTVDTAPFYFEKKDHNWEIINDKTIVEKEFAISVSLFLRKN
jgi:glutathione synthase/RimK-type ligase-like ATP-grasp enzyme